MRKLLSLIRKSISGKADPARGELTAAEYEAVCLIAYEGRAAYARARQQAFYCRARGSAQGFRFWSTWLSKLIGRQVRALGGLRTTMGNEN
jgi:hypothetical protein